MDNFEDVISSLSFEELVEVVNTNTEELNQFIENADIATQMVSEASDALEKDELTETGVQLVSVGLESLFSPFDISFENKPSNVNVRDESKLKSFLKSAFEFIEKIWKKLRTAFFKLRDIFRAFLKKLGVVFNQLDLKRDHLLRRAEKLSDLYRKDKRKANDFIVNTGFVEDYIPFEELSLDSNNEKSYNVKYNWHSSVSDALSDYHFNFETFKRNLNKFYSSLNLNEIVFFQEEYERLKLKVPDDNFVVQFVLDAKVIYDRFQSLNERRKKSGYLSDTALHVEIPGTSAYRLPWGLELRTNHVDDIEKLENLYEESKTSFMFEVFSGLRWTAVNNFHLQDLLVDNSGNNRTKRKFGYFTTDVPKGKGDTDKVEKIEALSPYILEDLLKKVPKHKKIVTIVSEIEKLNEKYINSFGMALKELAQDAERFYDKDVRYRVKMLAKAVAGISNQCATFIFAESTVVNETYKGFFKHAELSCEAYEKLYQQ